MKRRAFITLLGGAAAWPIAARAQQPNRMRTIGMLQPLPASDPDVGLRAKAFEQRLRELGWADGGNVRIDYRWAGLDAAHIRSHARQLVDLKPDVIVAVSTPVVAALRDETRDIPVVFVQVIDPVSAGFVASLARPAGNFTGVTNFEFSMGGKWLETLKDVSPQLVRAAAIYSPRTAPYAGSLLRSLTTAAPAFAVELIDTPVRDVAEIERAIDTFVRAPNGGLIVFPDATTLTHRELIIERAAQYRLPAIYPFRYFIVSGGLMSYGTDGIDTHRQAAEYVDRILRGAKPEDLPVQAPNKFELVINLKTARVLGLEIPPTLLARADEVIE